MCGVLCVAAGPAESASWTVFPAAVHRLLRGSVVGAGDCVAGRGFAEPAGFPGSGRDRGAAEPLDAVAHAASDRRVWCRGRRSASMRRRWKRTRRCGASSGGIPGNLTRRSCVSWRRHRGLRRRRERSSRGLTGLGRTGRRRTRSGSLRRTGTRRSRPGDGRHPLGDGAGCVGGRFGDAAGDAEGLPMDASGAGRLNRSSPSCLNRSAQRIDFFHGLLRTVVDIRLPTAPRRNPFLRFRGLARRQGNSRQCPKRSTTTIRLVRGFLPLRHNSGHRPTGPCPR